MPWEKAASCTDSDPPHGWDSLQTGPTDTFIRLHGFTKRLLGLWTRWTATEEIWCLWRLFNGTRADLNKRLVPFVCLWDGKAVSVFQFLLLSRLLDKTLHRGEKDGFLHRVVLVANGGKRKCYWGEWKASDLLEDTRVCQNKSTVITAVISYSTLKCVNVVSLRLLILVIFNVVYVCNKGFTAIYVISS